LHRKQQ
jgi:hypothetical protein